jgi:hypothetical protein
MAVLQPNILFPPFSTVFANDPRFPKTDELNERIDTFLSGLCSMLYQLSLESWEEGDLRFLSDFLRELYSILNLPIAGWFPPLLGDFKHESGFLKSTVPRIVGEFWNRNPNEQLISAYLPQYYLGRVYTEAPWDGKFVDEWESNTTKLLNIASRLQVLDKEEVRVVYYVREEIELSLYREFVDGHQMKANILYRFRIVSDVPMSFID